MSSAHNDRKSVPELAVTVIRYERRGAMNLPTEVSLHAVVHDGCAELDIPPGTEVQIEMSEHPSNANRLIPELMHGAEDFGVPQCGEGSLVRFTGCLGIAGSKLVQAAAYEVIEAVPVLAEASADRGRQMGAADGGSAHRLLPEPFGAAEGGPAHRLWP